MRKPSLFKLLPLAALSLATLSLPALADQTAQQQVVNPFSPAYNHEYRHGVLPTLETHAKMKAWREANTAAAVNGAAKAATGPQTLAFGGGSVISAAPRVYLVVMGAQWGSASTDSNGNLKLSNDPVGAVPYLQQLFKGLGTNGELWSGVLTQYCDGSGVASGATSCPAGAAHVGYPSGKAFAGIWYDNSSNAPGAATGAQLAQEAVNAAAHFGNTTAASNRYVQYVILSPTGTHPDNFNAGGGFCAWHSATGSSYGNIAYTNMPYVHDAGGSCGQGFVNGNSAQGALDGFSIVEGHEYAETVTDVYPSSGWVNRTGSNYNGQENGDECAWINSGSQAASQNVQLATGSFAMQSTWSNDTNACNISHAVVGGGIYLNTPYVLVNTNSGKALDVNGAGTVDGTKVQIWTRNGTVAQTWEIIANSNGGYSLVNPNSNKALDIPNAATASGTALQIWDQNSTVAQKWSFYSNTDGSYTLVNPNSNKALDVRSSGTADGTVVQIWDQNGTNAQHWQFVPAN